MDKKANIRTHNSYNNKTFLQHFLSHAATNRERDCTFKHSVNRKTPGGRHSCSHREENSSVPHNIERIFSLTNISVAGTKYTCECCGRNFAWPSSLRLHQKMACGKPPNFHCNICDYKSNFKGNLKRHLYCKHKIDLY